MRLFVAVNLPQLEQERITRATSSLRRLTGVRWTASDNLHITLKFLGSVDEARVPAIVDALQQAARAAPPFELALHGFGAFPDVRHPRIFWIGVTGSGILLLQRAVEERVAPLGFPIEARPFHPHVTLGRAQRDFTRADVTELARAADRLDYSAHLHVGSVDLMQSHSVPNGVSYSVVASADLGYRED